MTKQAPAGKAPASTKTAPTNGKTLKKVDEQTEPKKEVKAPKVLTARERLKQLPKLQKLSDKLEKLEESRSKLENFKIGSDGSQDTLIIGGSVGGDERFITSNSALISEVMKVLFKTIDEKQAETEKQIEELSI